MNGVYWLHTLRESRPISQWLNSRPLESLPFVIVTTRSASLGPGFQGATSRGVTVRVPASLLEQARMSVTLVDGTT